VVEAVLYATRNGAQVINLSLGGPHLTEAESRAIAHAVDAGVVVVAAAGNEGWQLDNYGPAMAAGAIVVAASDQHADPIDAVHLTAPGEAIVSLRAGGTHMMRKYAPSGNTANEHIVGPRQDQAAGHRHHAGQHTRSRLRDASVWTLRLLVTHADGHEREMRFAVHLE
jgi:hypothetical protein